MENSEARAKSKIINNYELRMEESEIKNNNFENNNPVEIKQITDEAPTEEQLKEEVVEISNKINLQQESATSTTKRVNEIRNELGLVGQETNIPSVDITIKNITQLENKKVELEKKLSEILKSDVSEKYIDIISKIKKSKIDWANSEELARRLKLKGVDDNDVTKIKEWLISNTNDVKTFVLPPDKFKEVIEIINEITQDDSIKQGAAFYVPGGRDDIHEDFKNAVFVPEKVTPPLPVPNGEIIPQKEYVNETQLSHELGHATQDGLLQADEFTNTWEPKFKNGAPDKEYVGQIQETDTRIRSMFNTLGSSFDPNKEVFGKKQLEILREKQKNGLLDKDTKDLLDHYDDIELVKLANRMPAI